MRYGVTDTTEQLFFQLLGQKICFLSVHNMTVSMLSVNLPRTASLLAEEMIRG